jgi:uncharacterized membrane protein YkoI
MLKRAIIFASLLIGGVAMAGKDVKIDDVPKEVRATIEKEAAGGQVKDIEQETKDGATLFEVELMRDKQKWELMIDSSGKVLSRNPD